jgi:hypothetical protein
MPWTWDLSILLNKQFPFTFKRINKLWYHKGTRKSWGIGKILTSSKIKNRMLFLCWMYNFWGTLYFRI